MVQIHSRVFGGLGSLSHAALLCLSSTGLSHAQEEYDYIVVGSGPGGGPVAVNLAKAGHSVLVLEAGDTTPVGPFGGYPHEVTWDFYVKHHEDDQKNANNNLATYRLPSGELWSGNKDVPDDAELLGIYYPRGATVGGSSMINAMVVHLPTESDWEYVADLTNDTSWSPENMRKVFERIEHNNYLTQGTPGHGFDGYFQTNLIPPPSNLTSVARMVLESIASQFGQDPERVTEYFENNPNALDPNRDHEEGITGQVAHAYEDFERYGSRDTIIEAVKNDAIPLTLSQYSLATKITFDTDGDKPRATGVEYSVGKSLYKADARNNGTIGEARHAKARKEVIVSGGAFNSPQLLKLSGIGPADELSQFDIDVLVDSPGVGHNMQDNQEMPVVGRLSQPGGASYNLQASVFLKTDHAPYGERDCFFMHGNFIFRGFQPDGQLNENTENGPSEKYSMSLVKQHPQNRAGTVKLRSNDPFEPPEINFNHYAEGREIDMGGMKDIVAWVRNMYADVEEPVGPIKPLEPPCPFDQILENGYCEDESIDEEWIEDQTFGHHPTSSCAIGADDDPNAVLDSKFRVRGVDGLRVVDASVFPRIPGVFPVAPTFIISQKASEVILEDEEAAGSR